MNDHMMLEKLISISKAEESLISPATNTPNHVLCLSELDFVETTYTTQFSVYEAEQQEGIQVPKDPERMLKDALQNVLVYFYPVAGRLKEVSHFQGSVVVDCNAKGVLFVQAHANCALQDVCFLCDPYAPSEQSSLSAAMDLSQPLHHIPLLSIQVTVFKCGGYVLGIKRSHVIMDGVGFSQFMRAFGETAKNNGQWLNSTLPKPIWDRELLSPRRPPQVNSFVKHHEELVPEELHIEHLKSRKPMVLFTFEFSEESIDRLKARVVREAGGEVKFCSTFEAVTALLWKTYAETMEVHGKASGLSLSGFRFSLNVRRALKKVLTESHDGYYGNCVVNASVVHRDLKAQNKGRDLRVWDVVKALRNEKEMLSTEKHVRSVIDYLSTEGLRQKKLALKKLLWDEMAFYDWSKLTWLPDFGVGRSKCFVYPRVFPFPCAMFLPKGRGQTHTSVKLALPEEIMPVFKESIEEVMFNSVSLLQQLPTSSRL